MADSLADGRTRVTWVTSISSIAAPTVAEINAGTRLDQYMTADGLVGVEPETADVDVSKLSDTFDTKTAGRASFSGTMIRLVKQSGTDAIYNALTRDTAGYLVVRRDITAGTANTIGDKNEVYPGVLGEVRNLPPEANSVHRYEVPVKVSSQPNLRATTA